MSKQILSEEFKRMQKLAGLINENEFYGDYDEDSVKQMLIDAGKDPQEVDNFMNDEEGYFSWSNMTFDHQPTDEDIKNAFVDAFKEWATGGTNSLYQDKPTHKSKVNWYYIEDNSDYPGPKGRTVPDAEGFNNPKKYKGTELYIAKGTEGWVDGNRFEDEDGNDVQYKAEYFEKI